MEPLLILLIVAVVLAAVVGFVVVRRSRGPLETELGTEAPPAPPAIGLRTRLGKTRHALAGRLTTLLGRSQLDGDFWQELEDTLVAADLGVATAARVVGEVKGTGPADGAEAREELERHLVDALAGRPRGLELTQSPAVVLVVGVNGTGKTTSIAKLAAHLEARGTSVVLGAADTFRAAAGDQLKLWAERVGVDIVGGQQGADPAAVAYDAFHAAKARKAGAVIIDTAGRLHSKANLMDELAKVARVLRREAGDIDEVLLVIDGTTGQNAIEQARTFAAAVGITGIIVTKLDGTARGGMTVAVEEELDIPVKFIGVGESMNDLIPFDPEAFVDALLGV